MNLWTLLRCRSDLRSLSKPVLWGSLPLASLPIHYQYGLNINLMLKAHNEISDITSFSSAPWNDGCKLITKFYCMYLRSWHSKTSLPNWEFWINEVVTLISNLWKCRKRTASETWRKFQSLELLLLSKSTNQRCITTSFTLSPIFADDFNAFFFQFPMETLLSNRYQ